MTKPAVYMMSFHQAPLDNLLNRFDAFLRKTGMTDIAFEKKFTAIKMHFGEYGNMAYLRPGYARTIAELVKECGGIPFASDTTTMYIGRRKNAIEHLETADLNGFNPSSLGCPIVMADGLKGDDDVIVPIDGDRIKEAKIARVFADSDIIITLSHFKCHEKMGMGGAVKNLAMGCASRRGKMEQHSDGKVKAVEGLCSGCGSCIRACASDAITVRDRKVCIDREKCTGCGMCLTACRYDAIFIDYDSHHSLCIKAAEYAAAAMKGKQGYHISVIADVTPYCDCRANCEVPISPNLGILASSDPVALDRACADLVNAQRPIPDSRADNGNEGDLITKANPSTNWRWTLDHAEEMGLGSQDYELIML